jgi:hypothetical protein
MDKFKNYQADFMQHFVGFDLSKKPIVERPSKPALTAAERYRTY